MIPLDLERVPGAASDQVHRVAGPAFRLQHPPQTGYVPLQGDARAGRRSATPQLVGQYLVVNCLSLRQYKQREDLGGQTPAEVQVTAVLQHPEGAERADFESHDG